MNRYIKIVLSIGIVAMAAYVAFNGNFFAEKKDTNMILLPSLPKPIALEYALITSAGQSTDAYIVNDITNKMMIHNYFMPQAEIEDMEGVRTIVFVAGYSALGIKLHHTSYGKELTRVQKLLARAKKDKLKVITVYIGGRQRRDKQTDELLRLLCKQTDYLIATEDADYDNFFSELAKDRRLLVTMARGVEHIEEPFTSAFR